MIDRTMQIPVGDGDHLSVIVDEPEGGVCYADVILCPPFGGAANSMFSFAYALALNGFRVYRPDFRNHVGLSSGAIDDAALSCQVDDITALTEMWPDAHLLAISLSAVPAVRALAHGARTRSAILMTPVIDVRSTLNSVLGADYFDTPEEEIPDNVKPLGYTVKRSFVTDCRTHGFKSIEDTNSDLSKLHLPLTCIAGDDDPWVAYADVRAVVEAYRNRGNQASLVTIPAATHRLDRNPVVAARYIEAMVRTCLVMAGIDTTPTFPTFDETMKSMAIIRRVRRESKRTIGIAALSS